jgi:WD40 repeat protein
MVFFYKKLITQPTVGEFGLPSIPSFAAVSPDRQRVAVATLHGAVSVFNLNSWTLETSLPAESVLVRRLAWSPDGEHLVTACEDGIVRTWDVRLARIASQFNTHHGRINDIKFSSDGQRFFTCGDDGQARSWTSSTGELLREFSGHAREVERLDLSSDDRLLTTASSDRTCAVWQADTAERVYSFSTDESGGRAVSVALSDDGKRVAVGNIYGCLYVCDITHRNAVLLGKLNDGIQDMVFLRDGELLATADRGGVISIHKMPGPFQISADSKLETLSSWTAHSGRINFLIHNGDQLISGGDDGTMRIWAPNVEGFRWPLYEEQPYCGVDVLANEQIVACEIAIHVWDVASRKKLASFAQGDEVWKQVASSSDGRWLAAARSKQLARFDLQTQEISEAWSIEQLASSPQMDMSNDGQRIAVLLTSDQELVQIYSAALSAPEFSFPVQQCRCVTFSPDGQWLAAGSLDDLHLYNLTTGEMKFLRGHTSTLASAAFSPNGKQMATVSHDRTLKIWDLGSGAELRSVVAHGDYVKSVTYLGDGKTLATAGDDGRVNFWHGDSGQPLGSLAESMAFHRIRFSPNGRIGAALLDFDNIIIYDGSMNELPMPNPLPGP